jgi:hypothetical protein
MGTSLQLACPIARHGADDSLPLSVVRVPFSEHADLFVAASLNGGNVLQAFVDVCLLFERYPYACFRCCVNGARS